MHWKVILKKLKLWRPTRPFRTNTQKRCLFHYRDWNAKVGSQEIPGVEASLALEYRMKQGKDNRVLPRERTGHSKCPLPTTQEKILHMDITRWSTPKSDWLYSLQPEVEKLYTSQQKQDQELTVSLDCELLIVKFRLKLKKVGKTIKPFRYDWNQIPYDYTVELRNRFQGLDLIDRVPDELWTESF